MSDPPPGRTPAYFQYVGPTTLQVVGGVTGRRYLFPRRGAIVAVDARDRRSVAAVPRLQRVPRLS